MPESTIGLFLDAGVSYSFARLLDPALAMYLALTGARISGGLGAS